jgi:BioD-like phosphotransacetylase family protein
VGRALSERCVDWILSARQALGERLIGIILNQVPPCEADPVSRTVVPYLRRQGIEVFGVIPRDHLLQATSVAELADHLSARVLCCQGKLDELVEHFSVGAMNVEGALRYFRRTPNKAVITGGDRSDIQLAALETSTRAIVLTGDLYPNSIILSRAEQQGVPILLTRDDTLSTVERIETLLGRQRVRSPKKIGRALELLRAHVDLDRLLAAAGVAL